MYYKLFFTLSLSCLLLANRSNAQSVPDNAALRKALSKQDAGYSVRSNDERYEGFYNKEKGQQDFTVLSLLKGKLDYAMDMTETLVVCTRKIPGIDSVYIAGASFNFWPDYRLDIRVKAGENAHVPLSAAIGIKKLFKNNLGIYGYTGSVGSPDCYIPMDVRSSVNRKNASTDYTLTLISEKSVSDISWDYVPTNKGWLAKPVQGDTTIARVTERNPIIIPLKFKQDIPLGSIVIVEVWGRVEGQPKRECLHKVKILIPKI